MSAEAIFACGELREAFPEIPPCCGSCHVDQDEYDYEPSWLDWTEYHIVGCCEVLGWCEQNQERVVRFLRGRK